MAAQHEKARSSPQFIRTDKAIRRAFIELMQRKSFEQITVQDILDETPVTRGTFYAHYKDKHDIAERLQAEVFAAEQEITAALADAKKERYPAIIRAHSHLEQEAVDALLRIHTDTVDLRAAWETRLRERYLLEHGGRNAETEAQVYASAMAAFQLSYLCADDTVRFNPRYVDEVFTAAFLTVLCIDTPENRSFIYQQIRMLTEK